VARQRARRRSDKSQQEAKEVCLKAIFTRQLAQPRSARSGPAGPGAETRSAKMAAPAHLIVALFRAARATKLRFVVVVALRHGHEFKGTREDRGSQRRLTVLSLPGLLCDRSSSNGESVPDGREAVRTRAKPSPRRRPSCSAAPRETHPAALQQTDRTVAMMHRCITRMVTSRLSGMAISSRAPRYRKKKGRKKLGGGKREEDSLVPGACCKADKSAERALARVSIFSYRNRASGPLELTAAERTRCSIFQGFEALTSSHKSQRISLDLVYRGYETRGNCNEFEEHSREDSRRAKRKSARSPKPRVRARSRFGRPACE